MFAIGDVHGDFLRASTLLREAGLVDAENHWTGGKSELIFIGDLTDRGVDGIRTISLVRQLQAEAAEGGGFVESLMGNHDAILLARAFELRGQPADPDCRELFRLNGGREREAKTVADDDDLFRWLQARPLMVAVGKTLFQHADSAAYYGQLGSTVEEVNAAGAKLASLATGAWHIFAEMTNGREWDTYGYRNRSAEDALTGHLQRFGMARVVHGHTRHLQPTPVVYAGGRAINVDGTLSVGYRNDLRRGFVADLDAIGYPSA